MESKNSGQEHKYKVYKRRWIMMAIFVLYCFNGSLFWVQFTIITDLITKYYNVSPTSVEWTANICMLSYIIFVVPSLALINHLGVRKSMIMGAAGIAIGNWIKVYSVAPDRFVFAMIGQSVSATFLMLTFGLIGRFIAIWFPVKEISVAGVIPFLGDQLGAACAFFIPPKLVRDGTIQEIGDGLRLMHLILSGVSTFIFLIVLFFFETKPKLPPSLSQAKKKEVKTEKFSTALLQLVKNRSFVYFLICLSTNLAPYIAITVLLNELLSKNYPDRVGDAGNIGSVMMISGMVGSLIIGRIQDKTRKYKECVICLMIIATISILLFTWALKSNCILFVYVVSGFLGFSVLSLMSNGLQMGLEITYPVPEHIFTTVQFLVMQFLAFIITVTYGYAVKIYGDLIPNIVICAIYVVGCIVLVLVPSEMRRSQAENSPKKGELKEFL